MFVRAWPGPTLQCHSCYLSRSPAFFIHPTFVRPHARPQGQLRDAHKELTALRTQLRLTQAAVEDAQIEAAARTQVGRQHYDTASRAVLCVDCVCML